MTDSALQALGWREYFADQFDSGEGLIPARVCRQDVDRYQLLAADGELWGILPGKLRIDTVSRADLPTVGDWVLCRPSDTADDPVVMERTLERFSKFSRKQAGDRFEEQVVAANIDTVLIVTGLDQNFNVARVERYLAVAWNSGARPVILLSKADLCDDIEARRNEIAGIAFDTPIHIVSAVTGEGLDRLGAYLGEGETVALLGSSGVGKSTIVNALLGYDRFETSEVRAGDSKGRHTTTYRELCKLDGGGLVIDTPGMRELQLWVDDGLGGFEDIEELASHCRFNDCQHESEPGCEVREAIASGVLDAARLERYQKLQRELAHFEEKQDAALRSEKSRRWRQIAKDFRKRPDKRDPT